MSIGQKLCRVQHNRIVKLRVLYHRNGSVVCRGQAAPSCTSICRRGIHGGDIRHRRFVMIKVHLCGIVEVGTATYTQAASWFLLVLLVQLVDI